MKSMLFIIPIVIWLIQSCQQQPRINELIVQPPTGSIMLSEAQIQLANIKVKEIKEASIGRNLVFNSVLKVNEKSAVNITARAKGRVQKLYFKNTGESVKKGDSLYQFYSEELIVAQREYYTLQHNNWNYSGRYEPSLVLENKLLFLGMLPSQIAQLRKDGKILFSVTILSPVSGIVRSVGIAENQYVDLGQVLFELADDHQLWVEAKVYQDDLPFLKVGMPSTVTVSLAGNSTIKSRISFINPSLEQGTNATLIRGEIENSHKNLYPGMSAVMRVQVQKDHGHVIPASALLMDKDGGRVWIQNEDGSFSCRLVTTGLHSEDSVMVLSGLGNSTRVVTSGAYLLNSELILKKGIVNLEAKEL